MNTEQKDYTLDQIIKESFDFSAYSDDEKAKLINETAGIIMETTMLRMLDEADQTTQEKFNTFLETDPDEKLMSKFIADNFPNFGKIIIEEIKIFKSMGDNKETKENVA